MIENGFVHLPEKGALASGLCPVGMKLGGTAPWSAAASRSADADGLSRPRKGLCEAVGLSMTMELLEGRRQFAVAPKTSTTIALAKKITARAKAAGVEIALVDGLGKFNEILFGCPNSMRYVKNAAGDDGGVQQGSRGSPRWRGTPRYRAICSMSPAWDAIEPVLKKWRQARRDPGYQRPAHASRAFFV
jgi:hypothetical protein